MGTAPTRIDEDVFAAAKAAGATNSRSASQQVNHWARIGRALESSASVRTRDLARVLAGSGSYDDLNRLEQAVVRAEWDERVATVREGLDLEAEFRTAGQGWVEADDDGRLVERAPHPTSEPSARRRRRRSS